MVLILSLSIGVIDDAMNRQFAQFLLFAFGLSSGLAQVGCATKPIDSEPDFGMLLFSIPMVTAFHGNFCGGIQLSAPTGESKDDAIDALTDTPANDELDAYCKRHDLCYQSLVTDGDSLEITLHSSTLEFPRG